MALFVGRHVNRIDKKGRVSVPKPFRAAFEGETFNGLYLYPHFQLRTYEACGEAFMARLADSLEDLPLFSEAHDDLSVILESAHRLAFDPEGRIVLPGEVVEDTGIEGQVLFVGRGQRFQVWEPKAYAVNRGTAFDRARARGATVMLRRAAADRVEKSGD